MKRIKSAFTLAELTGLIVVIGAFGALASYFVVVQEEHELLSALRAHTQLVSVNESILAKHIVRGTLRQTHDKGGHDDYDNMVIDVILETKSFMIAFGSPADDGDIVSREFDSDLARLLAKVHPEKAPILAFKLHDFPKRRQYAYEAGLGWADWDSTPNDGELYYHGKPFLFLVDPSNTRFVGGTEAR